jgi:hypothetical protein
MGAPSSRRAWLTAFSSYGEHMTSRKSKDIWEFGDFQTPYELALEVTQLLRSLNIVPRAILEPTCGQGAFLCAAASVFPEAEQLIGIDVNATHLAVAIERLKTVPGAERVTLHVGNFFKVAWDKVFASKSKSWLILGNPPWVTSAELSALESDNLPEKSNFHRRAGIEAMTGKSNFDISEWMLLRYLDWLHKYPGTLAVLCKTAVARKILIHAWREKYPVKAARLYTIDAMLHFGAAVDACLFILEAAPGFASHDCAVYPSLDASRPSHCIGFHRDILISDVASFERWHHLLGQDRAYTWRSGIKHDCAKIMELRADNGGFRNGLGEMVDLEDAFLFPLYKSSDIGNGRTNARVYMLVTQRTIGEDTARIQTEAPRTWEYLQSHAGLLNRRGSSIYRNRPPFSIFGVGEYSFAPWKVAISGFYKKLNFVKIGPVGQRPAVFDDTVYFLPCHSEAEADFLCTLLNSNEAQEFYGSMVFWADKRPITIDLLRRLSLKRLATELGQSERYARFTDRAEPKGAKEVMNQQLLFDLTTL